MHRTKQAALLICLGLATALAAPAQEQKDAEPLAPAVPLYVQVGKTVYRGDSIPHIITPTLNKFPAFTFKNERERQRYNRLVANVKKLLPLAKLAKYTIIETYDYLETLPDDKARARHIQKVEEGLKQQYGPLVKRLSRSQGRLLVKLIDRECNQTGYSIAKAFIGSFKANFYQALAFCFGNSLTKHYDPEGDDRYVERVVLMVESGQL